MTDKLRECPFCGSDRAFTDCNNGLWTVICQDCPCLVDDSSKTEQEAIEQWNHRPALDRLTAENERLKEMIVSGKVTERDREIISKCIAMAGSIIPRNKTEEESCEKLMTSEPKSDAGTLIKADGKGSVDGKTCCGTQRMAPSVRPDWVQACKQCGKLYVADSHEYPCPYCSIAALRKRVGELEILVRDAYNEGANEAMYGNSGFLPTTWWEESDAKKALTAQEGE